MSSKVNAFNNFFFGMAPMFLRSTHANAFFNALSSFGRLAGSNALGGTARSGFGGSRGLFTLTGRGLSAPSLLYQCFSKYCFDGDRSGSNLGKARFWCLSTRFFNETVPSSYSRSYNGFALLSSFAAAGRLLICGLNVHPVDLVFKRFYMRSFRSFPSFSSRVTMSSLPSWSSAARRDLFTPGRNVHSFFCFRYF